MKFFPKLFLLFLISLSLNTFSQNIITTSGLNFVPDTLNIYTGDSVNFILSTSHNAVEVDSLTYSINGSNPLIGGFNVGFGADTTIIFNTIKTYYYVCQPHVSLGMKGIIVVSNPTILGCTDPNACNYDSLATLDDGSCNYSTSSFSSVTSCDSYLWNGITYFNSGTYLITLTGSNGCDSVANLDLIIYNSPVLNITSGDVSCYGGNDGFIDLSSTANPSSFLWSTGETTEDIFNLSAGSYSVTVTDSNLCSTSISQLITQPSIIDTTLNISICSWDNFTIGSSLYNSTGNYLDTLIALNGCDSLVYLNLIVFDPINPGSILDDQFLCYGDIPPAHYVDVNASGADGSFSTIWQSSNDGISWNNIIGTNNNNSYQPGALFQTTYFRLEVTSDFGCGVVETNFVVDSVFNDLVPAIISDNQDICYDTSPQTLNITQLSQGGGILTSNSYTWEFSLNGLNGWQPILSGLSYSPSNLLVDHYYRVKTFSQSGCGPVYSNVIHINVYNPLSPGAISSSQNICYNSQPDSLSFTVLPSGADGNYTYIWQESLNNTTWSNLSLTDDTIYQPPVLDSTRYYRALVISDFGCGTVETSSLMINVYAEFITGAINTTDTICYNADANSVFTIIPPSGGHIPYSYEWSYSNDNINWTSIPGNNSPSYNPSLLTDTTYYRVNYVSNSGCGQLLSNTSQVVVLPIVVAGNIENDQFLCYDSLATPIYMDTVCYGGDNNFSYQWEFSTDGSNWNEVLGADTTVYNPGFMSLSTFYRLKVASTYDANCLDRYSNIIDVHVYDPLASGEINSSQDICYNTQPNSLSFSLPSSGADGNYTYIWQESLNNTTWSNLSLTDDTIYQPPVLDSTRYYRALVISDFGCGTVETSSLMIDVNADLNSGILSQNDTICYLENPNVIVFGSFPTGGNFNNSTQYDFQWQSNNNGIWNNIFNANDSFYQPLDLNDSTYYRVSVTSDCKVDYSSEVFIIVNPLPDTTLITGQMLVCENQIDVNYSILSPNANYRYEWVNADGQIFGTNESQNLLISWNTNEDSSSLGLYIRDYATSCEIYLDTMVSISENIAPQETELILKPNSSILVCPDSSANLQYQWGRTNINTGIETLFIEDTLRYNQYNNPIDTLVNRYWVDTYFNYSNNFSCITRSFFNPPSAPLGNDNINSNSNIIYPNPSTGEVFVIGKYNSIKIFDIYGKHILFVDKHLNNQINLSSLNKGVYFIVAETDDYSITNKIILH